MPQINTHSIDKEKPVLVTGATGYIAGWIVKYLLEQNFTVHCAVRDPSNQDKISHLKAMTSDQQKIKFFKADLLEEGSYSEAMKDCELVIHTASPFFLEPKSDAQKELIDPALKGTKNVLSSVNSTESVKRVVLTSSVASIYGDAIDAGEKKSHTMDETDWNETSSLSHNPYSYSKVIAERAAWEMNEKQNRWDMVVINPSLVLGPATKSDASFESRNIFKQFCDGTMALGCPDLNFGTVDVRDVAMAHINAGLNPHANGRYIISSTNINMLAIGQILRDEIGGMLFPRFHSPNFLMWLLAPALGVTREYVKKNLSQQIYFDNSRSQKENIVTYRALKETVVDFYNFLYSK